MIRSAYTRTYATVSELILDQIPLEIWNQLTGENLTSKDYCFETIDKYLDNLVENEDGDTHELTCELLEAEEKRLQEKGINIEFYFNPEDTLDIYYLAEIERLD